MSAPQWAWEAARRFWADAGGWCQPVDLRTAIYDAGLMVRVDEVPRLSAEQARDFVIRRDAVLLESVADRPLRGCLLVRDGSGWILLDADDPEDERRFTLAHELAHFLRHHLYPRSQLENSGRLRSALRGVYSMDYVHLMERGSGFVPPVVREAEEEADWLAVELLAPEEEFLARLPANAGREETAAVLREAFGLPASVASAHAARLAPEVECPLIARLKKY